MVGVPLIDLDGSPPAAARVAERPAMSRTAVLLVLLVIVATLGGSGSARPGLREVLVAGGTPAAAFELGAGALYTATYGLSNPNNESGVRRYDLATGREVWSTALGQGVQNLMVSDAAGVLMARNDWGISFLDTATGRLLWNVVSLNTSAVTLGRAGVLFTDHDTERTTVRLANPRTGATVWTRVVDARVFFGPDIVGEEPPQRIVAVGVSGTIVVLDFTTGREVSRGELGISLRPAFQPDTEGVVIGTVGEDRMVVRRRVAGRTTMSVYELEPFTRLWSRVVPPAGLAGDCGAVWCVSTGARNGVLTGIDPATGEVRWTVPDLAFAAPFGDRALIGGDGRETPDLTLRAQDTGRVLSRLGPAIRVGNLLLHIDSAVPGRTWVQVVDTAGGIRTVGDVDVGAPYGCEQLDAYLACPTPDGPTKVWRLP